MPFGSGRWYRPVKEEAFRVSGSDPDARDKEDARKGHGGHNAQLPISHPFEVEEFHCFACTEFIGSVVTYLYDVTGFVSTEKDRLRLLHLPAVLLNGANWIVVYERSFG